MRDQPENITVRSRGNDAVLEGNLRDKKIRSTKLHEKDRFVMIRVI